ncbi:hypothetical protein AGLY_008175, partial [Aphis glycines]
LVELEKSNKKIQNKLCVAKITVFLFNFCLKIILTSCNTKLKPHRVVVLSALVLKNEKSVGCHRPEITLSWCWATTTLGNVVVKSPAEEILSTGRESQRTHVGRMWFETLQAPGTPNVVQDTRRVLVTADQQSSRRFHADGGHRSIRSNNIYTTSRPQIPKPNGPIMASAHEHSSAPIQVPEWPLSAWYGCPVSQSVTYILQSPAPPLMSRLLLLLVSSMKQTSLTVPSCMANSISWPSRFDVSALNRISLTVLSLLPVAISEPSGVHDMQYIEPLWCLVRLNNTVGCWATEVVKWKKITYEFIKFK